ncbi:SMC-Scp complex subunit ScpB [Clostridium aestuarii]|uniref:Segregation and condensation protein B n=1 Tax=Clostridium aestuarii TaxID=338193 RepID=A0ABT4CXS1_9CLOT|nr:SMC-Scp complex subunit ScpB [Clostridium aestuarii]MCY6483776.1 SMC-Scp complex subunit ScpB [Clostridium aestuarii]
MKENNINQIEITEVSNKKRYLSIIESLLFVSGEALPIAEISSIINCSEEFTVNLLKEMQYKYDEDERGIKIISINNNYMFVTKAENGDFVQKLLKTNTRQSLSRAALESLATIVYKQPITRIEIDEIRGVKSDRAIQTLIEKKLIKEVGRKKVPGRPIMYATTEEFLRHFGLDNLKGMPTLESFLGEHEEVLGLNNENEEK